MPLASAIYHNCSLLLNNVACICFVGMNTKSIVIPYDFCCYTHFFKGKSVMAAECKCAIKDYPAANERIYIRCISIA
jgi:hypothetical protein